MRYPYPEPIGHQRYAGCCRRTYGSGLLVEQLPGHRHLLRSVCIAGKRYAAFKNNITGKQHTVRFHIQGQVTVGVCCTDRCQCKAYLARFERFLFFKVTVRRNQSEGLVDPGFQREQKANGLN